MIDTPNAPRERGHAPGAGLREVLETVLLALFIFLLVRSTLQNFEVEGRSMSPTLEDRQFILVNKFMYLSVDLEQLDQYIPFYDAHGETRRFFFRAPRRGDVVIFHPPNDPQRDFVKRVIGEPGDSIQIRRGTVYVNGVALDEPYVTFRDFQNYGPVVVPPEHYFVLGDNRPESEDSRARSIGMVPLESIVGQAWLTYWPLRDLDLVPNGHATLVPP